MTMLCWAVVAKSFWESVTLMVNCKVVAVLGVPLMTPVLELIERAPKDPDATEKV